MKAKMIQYRYSPGRRVQSPKQMTRYHKLLHEYNLIGTRINYKLYQLSTRNTVTHTKTKSHGNQNPKRFFIDWKTTIPDTNKPTNHTQSFSLDQLNSWIILGVQKWQSKIDHILDVKMDNLKSE